MSDDTMRVLSTRGPREVYIPDPRQRSTVGHYWNAIRSFLENGDDRPLRRLQVSLLDGPDGVLVGDVELEFDLDAIEEWAFRDELRFESIYES